MTIVHTTTCPACGEGDLHPEIEWTNVDDVAKEPVALHYQVCDHCGSDIADHTDSLINRAIGRAHDLENVEKVDSSNQTSSREHEEMVRAFKALKALNDRYDRLLAEVKSLRKDRDRLDWLADRDNLIGNVTLPTEIVWRNLDNMRNAIDEAMELPNEDTGTSQ